MRVSKWGQNCHFCMHYPFNMSICSHQHIAWDLLVPPRVDLVSDIKSSEGAGISWVCARREERETRRMGLGWQTHKDYQIQTDTHANMRILRHAHTQTEPFWELPAVWRSFIRLQTTCLLIFSMQAQQAFQLFSSLLLSHSLSHSC